jgi:NAD-dependent dihydropyrimidine dehydrogenase PreA subunit
MAYTIARDVCEGIGDCLAVCPTECISWVAGATNAKGTQYTRIDAARCIDCGSCLSVCPIEDAVVDEWRPERQGDAPGLPCQRCRGTVGEGRRFCQACGAPVAALCAYEDVVLLEGRALARLWVELKRLDSPQMLELSAVIRAILHRGDPHGFEGVPIRDVETAMAEYVLQTPPPEGTIGAPERTVAFYLRLLVGRGDITYTERGRS